MMKNQFALFHKKTFWPLFITQFLTAFNDNLCKTAFSVAIAYGLWHFGDYRPEIIVSIATSAFILPFVLLAPLAGNLADKYDKAVLIRKIKWAELIIITIALIGFYMQSASLLMVVLFALGTQSAFFSPNKFSILPQQLSANELIAGNALLNTGTYLAVLAGLLLGSLLTTIPGGFLYVSILLSLCSIIGLWASHAIPAAPPVDENKTLKLNWNTAAEMWKILSYIYKNKNDVFHALIGSTLFFFISGLIISQLPNYTSIVLKTDTLTLACLMIVFSIGISIGGLMNNRLLKSKVETTFVPLAAIGIGITITDLFFASQAFTTAHPATSETLHNTAYFLQHFEGWRILFDFLILALCGGLYIVPLKTYVQHHTTTTHIARIVAIGGFLDTLSILIASLLAAALLGYGWTIPELFLLITIGCTIFTPYMTILWPTHIKRKYKRS